MGYHSADTLDSPTIPGLLRKSGLRSRQSAIRNPQLQQPMHVRKFPLLPRPCQAILPLLRAGFCTLALCAPASEVAAQSSTIPPASPDGVAQAVVRQAGL